MQLSVSVLGAEPFELSVAPAMGPRALILEALDRENKGGAGIDESPALPYQVYIPELGKFMSAEEEDPQNATLQALGVRSGNFVKILHGRDAGIVRLCAFGPSTWGANMSAKDIAKGSKELRTDFTDALFRLVPSVSQLLKLRRDKEEYAMRLCHVNDSEQTVELGDWLNANLSLNEQDVPHGATILFYALSIVGQRHLNQCRAPAAEGWMVKTSQKADRKATGKKKRWCVLDDNFLVYYPDKKPTAKPKGIIDLEWMSISPTENNTKLKLEKSTESWTKRALCYVFTPEKGEFVPWERLLTRKCVNGAPFQYFGMSLNALKERERDSELPNLVTATIDYIEKSGLDGEGLFRVPGNASKIETWRDMCDRGAVDDVIEQFPKADSDSVAGLLKLFLRELPEPILTYSRYETFIKCGNKAPELSKLVAELPLPNQVLLERLLNHIALVETHKAKNKMDIDALVTVFAPNLLRPKIETADSLMRDSILVNATIRALITLRNLLTFQKPQMLRQATRPDSALVANKLLKPAGRRISSMNLSAALLGPGQKRLDGASAPQLAPPPALFTPPAETAGSFFAEASKNGGASAAASFLADDDDNDGPDTEDSTLTDSVDYDEDDAQPDVDAALAVPLPPPIALPMDLHSVPLPPPIADS